MIDLIGLSLIRQIVEAYDAAHETLTEIENRGEYDSLSGDYNQRLETYDRLAQDLLSHLLVMPCSEIDITDFVDYSEYIASLPEDERDDGELWDEWENVIQQAIAVYQSNVLAVEHG